MPLGVLALWATIAGAADITYDASIAQINEKVTGGGIVHRDDLHCYDPPGAASPRAAVRFIRLKYDGQGWDEGMYPSTRSDRNFLDEFQRVTQLKVSDKAESTTIPLLASYKKGYAPSFVYMTGTNTINISSNEIALLRQFLLDGSLLFSDCGSPHWDRSFRAFVEDLFPDDSLLTVPDDDPIHQVPFIFPNGPPPLFHYGGLKPQGIKRADRWMVYYYPGNLKALWQIGHSGISPKLAQQAYNLGVNVVYHAFTHYLEMTQSQRRGTNSIPTVRDTSPGIGNNTVPYARDPASMTTDHHATSASREVVITHSKAEPAEIPQTPTNLGISIQEMDVKTPATQRPVGKE